jgi:hypothetical protein
MPLPRTFVGFSSTDILRYRLMCAWKAHEHIDFDFADFQLDEAINSNSEQYIKQVCRNKIRLADTYALLIVRRDRRCQRANGFSLPDRAPPAGEAQGLSKQIFGYSLYGAYVRPIRRHG